MDLDENLAHDVKKLSGNITKDEQLQLIRNFRSLSELPSTFLNSSETQQKSSVIQQLNKLGCVDKLLRVMARVEEENSEDDVLVNQILEEASVTISNLCGRSASNAVIRDWNYKDGTIKIREPSFAEADLGWKTWDAGILLTRMIEERKIDVEGQTVLELGCGTGLTGILCVKMGAKHVWMTDYHPKVLENASFNASLNQIEPYTTVSCLDWNDLNNNQNDIKEMDIIPRSCDIIIAADVVYDESHPILVPTVVDHYVSSAKQLFFVVLCKRSHYLKEITLFEQNMANKGFSCVTREEIDHGSSSSASSSSSDLIFYCFRRKQS